MAFVNSPQVGIYRYASVNSFPRHALGVTPRAGNLGHLMPIFSTIFIQVFSQNIITEEKYKADDNWSLTTSLGGKRACEMIYMYPVLI